MNAPPTHTIPRRDPSPKPTAFCEDTKNGVCDFAQGVVSGVSAGFGSSLRRRSPVASSIRNNSCFSDNEELWNKNRNLMCVVDTLCKIRKARLNHGLGAGIRANRLVQKGRAQLRYCYFVAGFGFYLGRRLCRWDRWGVQCGHPCRAHDACERCDCLRDLRPRYLRSDRLNSTTERRRAGLNSCT